MTAARPRTAEVVVEVPFHDLDPAGIAWHGHYAKYFEIARCELLKTFSYNYDDMIASGYAWPVIDMHLRYVRAAVFGQRLRVRATLVEWEYRLKIEYLVTDEKTGERMTKGATVQVAVDMATREMRLRSPNILFAKLGLQP
ncbi:MAG TPA: acyl-CoA thioesterase [Nevskiaceae bacterium]|nr:acyl-CoA thioesterase [Nevskiaceae bacterium]